MRNVKSKIIATLVAASVLIPTTFAYAEGTENTESKLMNSINRQEQRIENLQQKQEVKAAIKQKKDIIKQNHETNAASRKEVAEKRATVKIIYKEIVENHKQLTSEDLSKIEIQLQAIETQVSALETTKGTIKSEFEQVRNALQNKNFDEAQVHLDNVISIQNTRTEGLKKLSVEMDTLISILQTASAKATTASS